MSEAPTRSLHCQKCGATFAIPKIPEPIRAQTMALVRGGRALEAMHELKVKAGVDLANGKAIVFHITEVKGQCNRCRRPLEEAEETVCANCNALNLNW